ncbi:5'/3'-nucleotidase SurE [Candidatus Nitronereus thalassa]|uniref:5'-nucleotidase SurE n=1 Tax=Candidatus Nitronereus thalassa TaxID=3020898 RepID=A0ABU3K6M9_9BACT|nr:5'/3'-nucleotidase SurE [Candidatus Nitronereus thalassa]MDT7042026.1 5'/3'-nucleotidase SurE [Candidatus Nitronereus thalassa]
MTILVANDDGIGSTGIRALAKALSALGDVWVVAPDRVQNAMGRAITLHKPLRLTQVGRQMYSVNGTPSDCITLAVGQLLKGKKLDLVVSGINKGLNLGDDVTNSGTVSAALEGAIREIPSVAVSMDGQKQFRFSVGAKVAFEIARMVMQHGLPADTLLNVNVPDLPTSKIQGMQFTSLSRRRYDNPVVEKMDPRGGKYYWIAGEQVSWNRKKHSDVDAITNGFVSLTPLHFDMTQYSALTKLRAWEPTLNKRVRTLHQSS